MKIILIGYPGSQKIVPASKYLTSKYLPGFDITYLNYKGDINGWAQYVADFLEYLTDGKIIFALDDYLVCGPLDEKIYKEANSAVGTIDGRLVCVKLCECSEQEHEEYPSTTQYTIWDRLFLIKLLRQVSTPWQFEIEGSKIMKQIGVHTIVKSCIPYFTNSSLSNRWSGIRWDGLKEDDIREINQSL
jgi:hypothetical protein